MSMATLERAILDELKSVANDNKIRKKDVLAWETGRNLRAGTGETLYYLPSLGVSVVVKKAEKGK